MPRKNAKELTRKSVSAVSAAGCRRAAAGCAMANRTDPSAIQIHGTNPQNLIEKILRSKIYGDAYWKEHCFALTAETFVDHAMELDHVGGTFGGNVRPTPFICLVLKLLQIQPEKEIVVEFIKNEEYKYVSLAERSIRSFSFFLVSRRNDKNTPFPA
jgi:hypothetical protein